MQDAIASVKRDLLKYKQASAKAEATSQAVAAEAHIEFMSPLEAQRQKYMKNRQRGERNDREAEVPTLSSCLPPAVLAPCRAYCVV